ncbi:hypothetical protein B9G55_12515 [Saccharibacillus sp. O16]|nr:hypothetical protein B9G55_12515 [Saccharibacillus sp. O16]
MEPQRESAKSYAKKIGRAALPLTIGLGLLLSGCGSEDLTGTQQLTYDGSTIEVPKKAERILFEWTSFPLEDAMALDVKVSAVPEDGGGHYAGVVADYAKDAEKIDTDDMDAVRAYDPDAIIMMGLDNTEHIRELSKVAPVILAGGPGVDWKENLRMMAALTAQKKKGEKLIADYEKDAEALVKKWNPNRDKKAVYLLSQDEGGTKFKVVPGSVIPTLYQDLGFQYPVKSEERTPMLTLDQLAKIDPDYIFMDGPWLYQGQSKADTLDLLGQDAKWQNLRAFKDGHLHLGALFEEGLSGTESYSRMYLLKRIGEELSS